MTTIVKTSDGMSLVAGYHYNAICEAVKNGEDKVWFNSSDLVHINDTKTDEFGNLIIWVDAMQDIILKD